MDRIWWVGLGGFLGANCRYWLGLWIAERFSSNFPIGTLTINTTGSFILGLFFALAIDRIPLDPAVRLLVAVGFCGGYTTFSTYSYEALTLLGERAYLPAATYVIGSVLLGLLAVWLGAALGRWIAG